MNGLQKHLMDPALLKEFCDELPRRYRLRMERSADLIAQRKELDRTERDLDRAIQAILDGVPGAQLNDQIGTLEARKAELRAILAEATEPPALLHPNMAEIYRSRLAALQEALRDPACRSTAIETLRTLIDRVDLVPENGELAIMLRGGLAAMLSFAADNKKPGTISGTGLSGLASQGSLVAGPATNDPCNLLKRFVSNRVSVDARTHFRLGARISSMVGLFIVNGVQQITFQPLWADNLFDESYPVVGQTVVGIEFSIGPCRRPILHRGERINAAVMCRDD